MADILAAFDELEKDDRKKKQKETKPSGKKSRLSSSFVSEGARRTRPRSLPQLNKQGSTLRPPTSADAAAERSPSIADSRRISFADPPRPGARRLWIATKSDSLTSGFAYDARLNKYGVSEEEWNHFSKDLVEAADITTPSWAWSFQRKNVIKKIRKELQYDGDLKRVLRKWNKLFRRQGFSAWLELPTAKGETDAPEEAAETKEEKERARRETKRFRIVVNSTDRGTSVYSRSSSLNRSVAGEAVGVQHDNVPDPELDDETKQEGEDNSKG